VSDLVLKRDIYYTQKPGEFDYETLWDFRKPNTPAELFNFLSDPAQFAAMAGSRPATTSSGPTDS
jgi:signal peptidase I